MSLSRKLLWCAGWGCWLGVNAAILWASPSGLDNIPTADTVPHRTVVFQEYSDFIHDSKPSHNLGFKMGLFDFVEVGMDRKAGPGHSGANLFQAKLKFDPSQYEAWKGSGLVFAGGIANVAWTGHGREISGQPFPYVVGSYKVKFEKRSLVRSHLGFGFQNDNEGIFFGFDREILRGFSLKTDYLVVNNGQDLLSSWGFIYEPGWKFPFHIAIEGWYSVSTQPKRENDVVLKANYIIRY